MIQLPTNWKSFLEWMILTWLMTFYCDLIAGITELKTGVESYQKAHALLKEQENSDETIIDQDIMDSTTTCGCTQDQALTPVDEDNHGLVSSFSELKAFCLEYSEDNPTLQIALKYLFEDNIFAAGYLESQKFGNLSLNHAL